jgi:IS30 family transposase
MGACYSHLSLDDRRVISEMVIARFPVTAIARHLGRHRSSIYREINRNFYHTNYKDCWGKAYRGYFAVMANDRSKRRRRKGRVKLLRSAALLDHVLARLRTGWSPQQVAGRLKRDADPIGQISHESIYRYIFSPDGREQKLFALLPCARRHRRRRFSRKSRKSAVPVARSITLRPAEIAERKEFGHWEADLMIFARKHGKANVTSLIERRTRYLILLSNEDRRSAKVVSAIRGALEPLPVPARRSITFDRGTEFVGAWRSLPLESWFCDPHSPWQKGSVENANGRVRRRLPLESAPGDRSPGALSRLATQANQTPRKCLGYQTPEEAFLKEVATVLATPYDPASPCRTST